MSGRRRLRRLLTDRRARIPFALIGILILLSAGVLLLHAETQSPSRESLDPDRAMERTDAAIQTVTRDAVSRASELAAQQPLTSTAETAYGSVLRNYSESSALSGSDEPFDAYLRALIYLEARDRFDTAGQRIDGAETEVFLPEISGPDSFGAAIERVRLTAGTADPELEPGTVRVSLDNVTTVLRRDGEEIYRRVKSVTVTVPTPVFQLHERTEEYQDRLDAGITDPGFTQRFNARIYALGWARGYAQYSGMPVTEVIANRHVIPSANDAVYRTQRDVFGAADPQLNNAIRRGWLCMAMKDAEALYNGYNRTGQANYAEHLCDASRWLFGEQATGNLPESPGVTDLIGEAPGMDAKRTLGVNETAYLPLRILASPAGEHSIEDTIDRVFEIESELAVSVSDVSEPEFDHDPPEGYRSGTDRHLSTTNQETSVNVEIVSKHPAPERYYTIVGDVQLTLEERREHTYRDESGVHSTTTADTGTLSVAFEIQLDEYDTGPNTNIDDYQANNGGAVDIDPENRYQPGPERSTARVSPTVPAGQPDGFRNYEGAPSGILAAFAGGTRSSYVEQWLEDRWANATSSSEMVGTERRTVALNRSTAVDSLLKTTVTRDIVRVQEEISDVNVTFERREIVHDGNGTGPYGKLLQEVRAAKASYLERDDPYQNVGQKVVYEARYAYFDRLESDLERLESANDAAMQSLDEELGDLGLGSALSFLQQGVTATPPDPVPLDSPSLTSNITYDVSGSPTYLVAERVSTLDVPAVDNDIDAFAPLAARNRNYLKLPYEAVIDGLLARIADLFGLGEPDAELTLRMAGEALQAGELAEDAADTGGEYADQQSLEQKTNRLETSVRSAVDQFHTDVTDQILFHLYPGDIHRPCTDERVCSRLTRNRLEAEFGEDVSCSLSGCEYNVTLQTVCAAVSCNAAQGSTAERSKPEISTAVRTAIRQSGENTAGRAIAIDEGRVTDPIVAELFDTLDAERYRPAYAGSATDDQWRAYLTSAVQPAVTRAANSATVSVGDTETVENLDTEIRQALETVSKDIVSERVEQYFGGQDFSIQKYDNWVNGVRSPVRVPAGMPILPLPGYWYATVNVWDVEVNAEYARFEATANMGSPERGGTTTYVREDLTVTREIAGATRTLGSVESIDFSGRSVLVVVVPPGGIGVGDRDDEEPECSPTWPVAGVVADGTIDCR